MECDLVGLDNAVIDDGVVVQYVLHDLFGSDLAELENGVLELEVIFLFDCLSDQFL